MQSIHNPYLNALSVLNSTGASYVIVGGFALTMHGNNRFTPDINVAVNFEDGAPLKLVEALLASGLEPPEGVDTQQYANPQVRADWFENKSMRFLAFGDRELPTFSIQLFTQHPQPMSFEGLLADSIEIDINGIKAVICSKEHLVAMKKIAWRNQDRDDVEALDLIESLGEDLFDTTAINELIAKEESSFARERLRSLHDFNLTSYAERADWLKNMLTALGGFCIL
ncbi:MAG: hypothetical protein R3A13_04295 [Bdellovibrionota bacterium]